MDKQHFIELLLHFPESSDADVKDVLALKEKFPYSQVFHALAARAAKDHQLPDQQHILQRAAVHSTDRAVLKQVMSAVAGTQRVDHASIAQTSHIAQVESEGNVDYATELIHDMERLQELKHNFETLFVDVVETGAILPTPEKKREEKKTEDTTTPVEQPAVSSPGLKKKPALSKRERLIQLSKELSSKPAESSPKKTGKRNKADDEDPLIEEIKEKKKQLSPANEKTKEQIEMIDQFIKSRSYSATPKTSASENEDLASALKSGEFGDNVISETLAEILIRQGKKEKAIEVYKKLIWKFPQKKAYFAAQIEELKK